MSDQVASRPNRAWPHEATAREEVVNRLRNEIVTGHVLPGEHIRESQMAEQLGVSRTPVREAFLVLAVEGLLTLQHGRGARVRDYDPSEIHLVHEIRSLVEGRIARFATDAVSNKQITLLNESCARLEALTVGDVQECNKENVYFHNSIFEIVGSSRLRHIGRHLLEIPLPYKTSYWSDEAQKNRSEAAHREVAAALAIRDRDAAEDAMRRHVLSTGEYIAEWLKSSVK